MKKNRLEKLFPLLVSGLVSVGCSNSADKEQGNEEVIIGSSKIGVLSIRQGVGNVIDAHATYDGVFGEFLQMESSITSDEFLSIYQLPLDTCITFDSPDDVLVIPASSIRTYNYDSSLERSHISAGEVITVSSLAGTWLEVQRNVETSGDIYYANSSEISELVPTQLSITIPGDEYPAFTIELAPRIEPLTVLAPDENTILELDAQFRWSPLNRQDTYIRITAQKLIGSKTFYLDCMATDDGEFEIPIQIQEELGNLFNDYAVSFSRTTHYLESINDSMLLVTHSSGAN